MQTTVQPQQMRAGCRRSQMRARMSIRAAAPSSTVTGVKVVVREQGTYTVKGSVRKINEDRSVTEVPGQASEAFVGVFDGHGGYTVADWLQRKLPAVVAKSWRPSAPENSLTDAFLEADSSLLTPKSGFMGLGERGVGGSKCGATAAVAVLYEDGAAGSTKLATANIGDARIVLIRNGQPVQLTVDHVPDDEDERKRIEKFNPNPRLPLVRYVGGTWRVGGLLALSRAFGDAYLKGSLQFEGLMEGSDGYSSGFGVIAEPYTTVTELTAGDSWLVVASDGLFAEVERGGGGGLDNAALTELLQEAGSAPCDKIAETLASTAVAMGSTDDVTVVIMRLGSSSD